MISPEDLSFYKMAHSPQDAVDWIKSYSHNYHSVRQVRNTLVVRLERELSDSHLADLNESFVDLVASGEITRTKPLPQEKDPPALLDKPRISFKYDRANTRRFNQFILAINGMDVAG